MSTTPRFPSASTVSPVHSAELGSVHTDPAPSPPSGTPGSRRPTTRRMWVALIGLDVAMSAASIPRLLEDLRARVPADIAEGVGDERLLDLSLRIGAYLSVPAHALALVVIALVAGSLERHVFSASREFTPSLRIGAFWLLVAFATLPLRVLSLAGVELGGAGWLLFYLVAALIATLGVFRVEWTRLSATSKGVTMVLGLVFVVAISWGK